jgi:hypothetical protein
MFWAFLDGCDEVVARRHDGTWRIDEGDLQSEVGSSGQSSLSVSAALYLLNEIF